MSDVNTYIEQWKKCLNKAGSYNAENIEELEGHLRDSTENLINQGLSEKEAFMVASSRLGYSSIFTEEVNEETGILVWGRWVVLMLLGCLIVQVGGQLSSVVLFLFQIVAALTSAPPVIITGIAIGIRVVFTIVLIAIIFTGPMLYLKSSKLKKIVNGSRVLWIILGIVAIGVTILSLILPQVYMMILSRIKDMNEIGRYMMYNPIIAYGSVVLMMLVNIVGILIIDQNMRKKRQRMILERKRKEQELLA